MYFIWTVIKWALIITLGILLLPLIFVVVVGWAMIAGSILDSF